MAGKIRTSQDKLTIKLDTKNVDLTTGIDSVAIEYRDPDGNTGSWTGSVVETTKVQYSLGDDEFLDVRGIWEVVSRINFTDGRTASGDVFKFMVYDPWE